LIKLDHWQFF